jgi:hypothetical protein
MAIVTKECSRARRQIRHSCSNKFLQDSEYFFFFFFLTLHEHCISFKERRKQVQYMVKLYISVPNIKIRFR